MASTEDFYAALASEGPSRGFGVRSRSSSEPGVPRELLLAELDGLRADLWRSGREDDEDVVLDVMEFLTGWSSPHMRL